MLEIVDLVVGRDKPLFKGKFTLKVEAGKKIAILGLNGAGKTTLMLHLAGLLPTLSGDIKFHSVSIFTIKPYLLALERSFISQHLPKDIFFNVREFLELGLIQKSTLSKERKEYVISYLMLDKYLDRSIKNLSGGEVRKVSIARALIQPNRLVFLDEPDAFLDPIATKHIFELLDAFSKKFGHTIIISTHNINEAINWSDIIILCAPNKELIYGNPLDILKRKGGVYYGRPLTIKKVNGIGNYAFFL